MATQQQNLARNHQTGLADYDGLSPEKQSLLLRQFDYLLRSGALPKHIRTPQQLFLAYKLLKPLGLDVIINLRNIWQNPSTGAFELCNDAPLAACQSRRDEYVGTIEWHVNAKNERRTVDNFIGFKAEGAVCIAKRKGREDADGMYSMDQARVAGLTTKDNWRKHPEAMLTKRARAIALRKQWSDVLGGVGIHEADDFAAPSAGQRDGDLARSMLRRSEPEAGRALPPGAKPAAPEPAKGPSVVATPPAPARPAPKRPEPEVVDHDLDDDLDVILSEDALDEREPGAED